jgi:hypothetical protein
MDLRETGWKGVDWMSLPQGRDQWRVVVNKIMNLWVPYEGVSKTFRTEPITKYKLTTINTRSEATQRVMIAKLTRLTHKIAT